MAAKRQALHVVFLFSTAFLFTNSICIVYNYVTATRPLTKAIQECVCPQCSYVSHTTAEKPPKTIPAPPPPSSSLRGGMSHHNPSFTPTEYFLPPGHSTLPHISSRSSLTRVGSELSNFDPSSCPSDSYVNQLRNEPTEPPMHASCPAVFIVGARKGGTTSLYHYLSSHPQFEGIRLDEGPTSGETFHFSSRYNTESWEEYVSKFPKQYIMTGDASVGNFVNCKVPKRIFESCGNFSKIIILLRNPVNRYMSNFRMRVALGTRQFNNNTAISTSIKIDVQRYIDTHLSHGIDIETAMGKRGPRSKNWDKLRCLFGPSSNMVYEGAYYIHVMNWLCNYPLQNILIINSEEFFDKSADILKEVYQFLGMDELTDDHRKVISSFIYNKQVHPPLQNHVLRETDRRKLLTVYGSFNDRIFKLLNWHHEEIDWD